MIIEPEHEVVPVIRDWLAATSNVEIPVGPTRAESRRQARALLAAIVAGTVIPDQAEMDDGLKDILWASVEELDEKPLGQPTLEDCNRFYQFVAALSLGKDPFYERDEVLHRVARIGWRSASGGLEGVLAARAAIWEHGDEQRHREVCETADQLPDRIAALGRQRTVEPEDTHELCGRLFRLLDSRPSLVAVCALSLSAIVDGLDTRFGCLDDQEFLRATTALIGGCAARQTGSWGAALEGYFRAASAFRRTAKPSDIDRVDVERLSLAFIRQNNDAVVLAAPALIARVSVPRERLKARVLYASSLMVLGRSEEARSVLKVAESDPAIESEPHFRIWILTKLGTALSFLGREVEAMESFGAAGDVLAEYPDPMQMGGLAGAIGEHLARLSRLEEATVLYKKAREISRQIGQLQHVAYLSVLRAELLMLLGKNDQAQSELVTALPLIDKFDLRREAMAAVALLREAMKKRQTDVTTIQALREQLRKGLH